MTFSCIMPQGEKHESLSYPIFSRRNMSYKYHSSYVTWFNFIFGVRNCDFVALWNTLAKKYIPVPNSVNIV